MADTYTQLYIHIVFSVKGRHPLIPKQHKAELHKYITGIITNKKQKMIQINSMPDHIHILIGMPPDIAISDLVRDIKRNTTQFINRKHARNTIRPTLRLLRRGSLRLSCAIDIAIRWSGGIHKQGEKQYESG